MSENKIIGPKDLISPVMMRLTDIIAELGTIMGTSKTTYPILPNKDLAEIEKLFAGLGQ